MHRAWIVLALCLGTAYVVSAQTRADNSRYKVLLQDRTGAYMLDICADVLRQANDLETQLKQSRDENARLKEKPSETPVAQ